MNNIARAFSRSWAASRFSSFFSRFGIKTDLCKCKLFRTARFYPQIKLYLRNTQYLRVRQNISDVRRSSIGMSYTAKKCYLPKEPFNDRKVSGSEYLSDLIRAYLRRREPTALHYCRALHPQRKLHVRILILLSGLPLRNTDKKPTMRSCAYTFRRVGF